MKLSPAKQLALVLLAALVVRLGVAWWWHDRLDGRFLFGDSQSYWELAQDVAAGGPYEYGHGQRIFRTPGYPILLAPIFIAGGDEPPVFWARVLSAVFGTLCVAGVWWLARGLFGPTAGLTASVLAAAYPEAIAGSVLVLTEAPFGPWMLLHLILWTAAWQSPSTGRAGWLAFGGGLAAGAATLIRPSWLLFIPFAVAVGVALGRSRTRHLALGAAMLAGVVVMMAPWWIRNGRVCGHFVPTTLQVGPSLYDGLNPRATGASDMGFVPRLTAAERADPASAGGTPADTFEYRLDRRMRSESVAWARGNPAAVARLAMVKFGRIWNFWPNEQALANWPIRLAVAAAYLPVMLLAGWSAWRTIGRGWPYVLCWLPAVYFTLLHVVFVASIRYRQPAMLGLIVLAAGAIVAWTNADRERNAKPC